MKLFRSKRSTDLDRAISQLRDEQPDPKTLAESSDRVWQRLQTAESGEPATGALRPIRGCADIRFLLPAFQRRELAPSRSLIVEDHLRECVACRAYSSGRRSGDATGVNWGIEPISRGFQWSFLRFCLAAGTAAFLLFSVWAGRNWYFAGPPGSRARIDSIEGQAFRLGPAGERVLHPGDELGEGEFIRTSGKSHARLRLFDGSAVELNQRAELAVQAGRRDTTIHLAQGSIIVQAAKRHTGHLYVSARDCTVAVTGTVFSVNSGTKGSRVAVIEGEVRVKQGGIESILHSGDEVATTASVGLVPVRQEIEWSHDLDHELALLAEFSKLREKLEQIPTPGPRYESKILPLLPRETVLYIGIPNLGSALGQANQIFQQQLSQSKLLQDWWNSSGNSNQHPTPQELIKQIEAISQYLGDEVVITAQGSFGSGGHGPVLLAEVRQPGLKDYLETQLAGAMPDPQSRSSLLVVDRQSLASLDAGAHGMIMLVRPNMLVIGGEAGSVRQFNSLLETGAARFTETDFGRRITGVYERGAGILVAANLGQILKGAPGGRGDSTVLRNSGFSDLKYLIATHDGSSAHPDNRMALEFNGQRQGIASWLAAPTPMGSLDYLSSNAGAAVSFVAKQPALMLDDIFGILGATDPQFDQTLARTNSELGLDLRDDLARALGGEVTLALDGPVLPSPSWKAVVEVNDSGTLTVAIDKLVQRLNREAQKSSRPGVTQTESQVGGRTFYKIQTGSAALSTEFDYTFADGYLILAPSRALLLEALQTHANGTSLARSSSFHALLPHDTQANFSAMIYQNLSPILNPLASQLSAGQLALVRQLAADANPSLYCAYGEQDRIELASSSRLFDLNLGLPTLIRLVGLSDHGTSPQANP